MGCPCCHRAMPTPKGTNKKFEQDRERCAYAIGVLERRTCDAWCSHYRNADASAMCRQSASEELARLQRAYNTPAILWSIFRRADKGASYAENVLPVAVPASIKRARKAIAA